MTIVETINEQMKDAMRARNQLRLDVLRALKSKILAADARCNLPDPEVLKLFKTYLGNLQEALEQSLSANRPEIVDKLKQEIEIVKEFLPKALSLQESKKIVEQAIIDSGAKTKRDLGLVMKAIKSINSQVDGKTAKELADQLLGD